MISKPALRFRHRFVLSVVAVMTAVASGCAGNTPVDDQRTPEQSTGNPASTTVETPPELVRATGTEPGCLLLESIVKRYQLLGTRRPV